MTRPRVYALGLIAIATVLSAAGLAAADDNRGTVKVHDDAVVSPEQRNDPHVSCDFWIQAFNMKDPTGTLVFYSWPPTGDKSVVTPTGDSLDWTGTPDGDGDGEWDFTKGPYQLPAGHYRVEVYTDDGHPSGKDHFAKAKMFWVDECEAPPPTNPTPPGDETCPEDMRAEDCVVIPFFPTPASAALGVLGAAALVGMVAMRRRP